MGRFHSWGPRTPPNIRKWQPQMIKICNSPLGLSKDELRVLFKDEDVEDSVKAYFAAHKKRKNPNGNEGDDNDGDELTLGIAEKILMKKLRANELRDGVNQ